MRDSSPFQVYLIVDNQFLSKIKLYELSIQLRERGRIERLSRLSHLMSLLLKLSKHGLSIHCTLKALKIVIEKE